MIIECEEEEECQHLFEDEREKSTWIYENKSELTQLLVGFTVTALVILIGWKMFQLNQKIKEQNENIEKYAQQMDNIIEDTDKLVSISWKDQKEGIEFVENPGYKKKKSDDMSQAEELQR